MTFSAQFDELHLQATRATGLSDFGGTDYREPMAKMLSDLDRFSSFTPDGADAIIAGLVGRLAGRLVATAGFKSHPAIDTVEIRRPLFIVGMARSGTTALLRLLSADPDVQGLELWLGSSPMPRPPRETWENNPAYKKVDAGLEQLFKAHPAIKVIHPMHASKPDEDRFALDQTFWSPASMNTYYLPEYGEWVLTGDATSAYAYYRRVLALIGGGDERRWVLKDPSHLFGIDSLLKTFPDACIVQTHRSLSKSIGSIASSLWGHRHQREPELTKAELGRQMCEVWLPALEKMESVRQQSGPDRFFDLHIEEIQANPVGAVERIFSHFDLPVSDRSRAAWHDHSTSDPRAGHGKHDFETSDFGLDEDALRSRAPKYAQRYQTVVSAKAI